MKVGLLKIREPIWNGRNSNEKIGVSTHHFNTFETLWIQVGWETLNLEQPFPNTYIMTKDFFNNYSKRDCITHHIKGRVIKEFKIKHLQIKEV